MADVRNTAEFKALAAQTTAVLLTRGLEVEPVAVHNVLAHMVDVVATGLGIQPRSALRYVEPETVADKIAEAAAHDTAGSESVDGVRPVRVDDRKVSMPRWIPGHQVMALAQAAKYAAVNGDSRSMAHALDLLTEVGAAAVADPDSDRIEIPVGLLDEAAEIIDSVAARIEDAGWSLCPCGEEHEQSALDVKVAGTFRRDADLARKLRAQADQ
ncbi:hypothetical protein P3T36_004536 [Kitasatospora sp. MAP12-15]|uniref:hypothetical protein n=1 Tax=unclassified Kitasatospora TaxID=2633591 RepID=UPI00247642ED|nr:hypothetical protein [Kitasatospora sp. MAP12-44]MDH6111382.1 hypothetical protein [Kitasatospora sp. MAP12-44]